ncbi:MAG: hypothetical protein ACLP1D_22865 [Xanthobacteraceae bacterium]|jgi:hypothetical protein
MLILLRSLMLAAGVALVIAPARAEDAPADTTSFVAACADNIEVCRQAVLEINNFNKLTKMGIGDGSLGRCTFPETMAGASRTRADVVRDSTTATKAILAWLVNNGAKRNPKSQQAILQAEQALWPSNCI